MVSIEPTGDQLRQLRDLAHEGPIVMLNLLKFKPGGAESYDRYAKVATRLVAELGGRVLYYDTQKMPFIGHEEWDTVLLVEYPSRTAFLSMIANEKYRSVAHYRHDALIDSRLYALETVPPKA